MITHIVSHLKAFEQALKDGVTLKYHCFLSYGFRTGIPTYLSWLLVHAGSQSYQSHHLWPPPAGTYGQIRLLVEPSLNNQPEGRNPEMFGHRVFEYADFAMMKRWLDICKGSHIGKCNSNRRASMDKNFAIRVVDVKNQCITSIDISSQYVALSYVWGGNEVPQLKLEASTLKHLSSTESLTGDDTPTTISDSIKVCQLLGKRYLWVDALCIMQDDPEEQASQIKEMHKIYANAEFTIVAAGGPDSWAGLPGISERKVLQHIEVLQEQIVPRSLTSSLPTFQDSIVDSVWITRAWTLQEMYFSRRLLYFTRAQIYFQCEESLWQEDKVLENVPVAVDRPPEPLSGPRPPPYPPASGIRYLLKHGMRENETPPMLRYQDLLRTYLQRRLTNGSDILNGFAGIMESFSESMNWEFLYGLPAQFFDAALLSQRRDLRCQFRDIGFPSWSWPGWAEGLEPLMTPLPGITYNENYNVFKENEWYHVQAGQYVKINNWKVREPPIEWPTWRSSKISELAPVPSELTAPEQERLLVFQASSAFMLVTSGTSLRRDDHSACTVAISADRQWRLTEICEIVNLTGRGNPENRTREVEFVVVASCKWAYIPGSAHPEESPDGWLRLMAIETDSKGISKRIDMAEHGVSKAEWLSYEPKWRTVFML
jgi:hypothetical protein